MVITYQGGECVKISQGDLTLAFNPPAKDSSIKVSKFGADIVLSTLDTPDFNGVDTASIGDKKPFAIAGPGEYEVKGVAVRGFATKGTYEGAHVNTMYVVSLDGVNICFLGAFGESDLPSQAKQALDDIDILFTPIGGNGVLDHQAAYKRAVGIEPKVVIPMHYGEIGNKDALKSFLKEAGAEDVKPIEKLTLKRKDLEGKEAEIIVLAAN